MKQNVERMNFSLIELKVLILIAAVGAAFMVCAIQVSQEKAMQTACAANLKKIAAATAAYVQNNNDYLPLVKRGGTESYLARFWCAVLDSEMSKYTNTNGQLKNPAFICPADTGAKGRCNNSYAVPAGTGMTDDWKKYERVTNLPTKPRQLATVEKPDEAAYCMDYVQKYHSPFWTTIWNKSEDEVWLAVGSAYRHEDSINSSWLDGHVTNCKKAGNCVPVFNQAYSSEINMQSDYATSWSYR